MCAYVCEFSCMPATINAIKSRGIVYVRAKTKSKILYNIQFQFQLLCTKLFINFHASKHTTEYWIPTTAIQ